MLYLLDTNSYIYLLSGAYPYLASRVAASDAGSIGMSAIVFAELAIGSANGKLPPIDVLDDVLAATPLIAFDEAAARAYARVPFRRARFDRLLAAHALSLGAVVVTNNEADFADVPDLTIVNWTKA
jgi:tRNA(fMet)-specific endonuclease VapC